MELNNTNLVSLWCLHLKTCTLGLMHTIVQPQNTHTQSAAYLHTLQHAKAKEGVCMSSCVYQELLLAAFLLFNIPSFIRLFESVLSSTPLCVSFFGLVTFKDRTESAEAAGCRSGMSASPKLKLYPAGLSVTYSLQAFEGKSVVVFLGKLCIYFGHWWHQLLLSRKTVELRGKQTWGQTNARLHLRV